MTIRSIFCVFFALVSAAGSAPLTYAPVVLANPLKGFMPYDGDRGPEAFPHSMEFFYLPLKDLMNGPSCFTWEPLDAKLDQIARRGRQAVFRIYLDYPQKDPGTPDFLRSGPDDLIMKSYDEHHNRGRSASPDYSNVRLRAALRAFIAALGARYDGDARVGFIQVGLLGFWGEWHTFPHSWMPSLAVMEEVLAAYQKAFKKTRLLVREPKDAAFRNYRIGYHDDSFAYSTLAPPDWHFGGKLVTFGETDRWKAEPIGGEIRPENQPRMWEDPATVPEGQDFGLCIAALHPSWMLAHGAFRKDLSPAARALAETQSRMLGYELHLPNATMTCENPRGPITISTVLRNTGVAPFYYEWPIELAVLNGENEMIHKLETDWSLAGLLPKEPDRVWISTIPADTLPAGEFKILLRVVNPLAGGLPLRFANTSQDADLPGWLTLGPLKVPPR